MKRLNWEQVDSYKAKQIWEEYQKQHNLSDRIGQTVGIDPQSKRIWFGSSIRDPREFRGLAVHLECPNNSKIYHS